MAKILGPLHSDRVKGSISGMTFREYRGMSTVVRRPRPVDRRTTLLSNNRSIFGYLSRKWSLIPLADRLLWSDFAATHPRSNGMGGTFQLDGNQMFMSLNHTSIRLGGAAGEFATPPIIESPAEVDTLVAVEGVAEGGVTLTWTVLGTADAGDFIEVQLAGPFNSPGRVSIGSRFKYQSDQIGTLLTLEVTGLQPAAWYWFRVRYVDISGQISNWVGDQSQSKVGV